MAIAYISYAPNHGLIGFIQVREYKVKKNDIYIWGTLPLASQSWKDAAPSCLVLSPPPQDMHWDLPVSSWYIPRGQNWQGL